MARLTLSALDRVRKNLAEGTVILRKNGDVEVKGLENIIRPGQITPDGLVYMGRHPQERDHLLLVGTPTGSDLLNHRYATKFAEMMAAYTIYEGARLPTPEEVQHIVRQARIEGMNVNLQLDFAATGADGRFMTSEYTPNDPINRPKEVDLEVTAIQLRDNKRIRIYVEEEALTRAVRVVEPDVIERNLG